MGRQAHWYPLAEKIREDDRAIIRRWIRGKSDTQLQHTENRYEIEIDGKIVTSETITQSPALRWYTQDQAQQLFEVAGFKVIQIYNGFEFEPASETAHIFTILGEKPTN